MLTFQYSSHIAAPVEEVFAFHERADALNLLSPPGDGTEIVSRTGGLEVGAIVELRVPFGPFKLRWLAHHIGYEKNRLFIDEQREGPFAAWVHAHLFEPEGEGTRLTDSIEYALPGYLSGACWRLAHTQKAAADIRVPAFGHETGLRAISWKYQCKDVHSCSRAQ